jgi:flap endonuclease-1
MQFTYDEFIDFCILSGCDYTTRIKNIGVVTAYKFIKNYGNI